MKTTRWDGRDHDEDRLRQLVKENPKRTVREYAEQLEVSHTAVEEHLKSMGMVKKLDKWIPHNLTDMHKQRRMEICLSHLQS